MPVSSPQGHAALCRLGVSMREFPPLDHYRVYIDQRMDVTRIELKTLILIINNRIELHGKLRQITLRRIHQRFLPLTHFALSYGTMSVLD